MCCAASLSRPARDVERLWSLDAIGIKEPDTGPFSAEEEEAIRQFQRSISYDGRTYTVAMPKRSSITTLYNNLSVALDRLHRKRRSLLLNEAMYQRYDSEIMSFVNDGHATEVHDYDLTKSDAVDGTYFMPHQQVITHAADKEKWRIVFDCSAAAPGRSSLNAHLLVGPNLNPDVVKMLLNFRLRHIAVSADIARAYMMINLAEADRPYFRFLWKGPADANVRCFQMNKVTWGAASSSFLLAATLRELFKRVDPESKH